MARSGSAGSQPPCIARSCYAKPAAFNSHMLMISQHLVGVGAFPGQRMKVTVIWIGGTIAFVFLVPVGAILLSMLFGTGEIIALGIGVVAYCLVPVAHERSRLRLIRCILDERRCLNCGYSLVACRVDELESGVCPECGRDFNLAEYRRPCDEHPPTDVVIDAVYPHYQASNGYKASVDRARRMLPD